MWTLCLSIFVVVVCSATDEELPPRPELEPPPPLDPGVGIGEGVMKKEGDFKLDGGDLVLSGEQHNILYGEGPQSYAGSLNYRTLWANGVVPYRFRSDDFSSEEINDMRQAMDVYEQETCIRFVERSDQKDFVQLQDGKSGCNANLGNLQRGEQKLNLGKECMHFGIYLHELGHAVGLLHEHQMPNRDDHVKFFAENVDPKKFSQLKKYVSGVATEHTGYDLSSIMHYKLTHSSKDGVSPTFGIENSFMEKHIGRRDSYLLSFGDVKSLNRLYECHAECKNVDCPDPGFINKKCECVTPEEYNSRVCVDDPVHEDWCHEITKIGACDKEKVYHQKHCARTCDLCPRFLPGDSGLLKPEPCTNHYRYPEKCDRWAAEGTCKSNPSWMKRYCRKSCNACNEQIGVCANKIDDVVCDSFANHWNQCTSEKVGEKTRKECPDSCKVCPTS